jgi:hypothetical protein
MLYPVDKSSPITQLFGENPQWYPLTNGHNGIDWGIPEGTPVRAAMDGTIARAELDTTGYGKHVRILHPDGAMTIYGHLSNYACKAGDKVKAGDIIGYSGNTGNSTGPHLHFEYRMVPDNGKSAVDPLKYLTLAPIPDQPALLKAKVLADILNIRDGPGTNFKKIGQLKAGQEINVVNLAGATIWVQIGPTQYVCARMENEDYIRID